MSYTKHWPQIGFWLVSIKNFFLAKPCGESGILVPSPGMESRPSAKVQGGYTGLPGNSLVTYFNPVLLLCLGVVTKEGKISFTGNFTDSLSQLSVLQLEPRRHSRLLPPLLGGQLRSCRVPPRNASWQHLHWLEGDGPSPRPALASPGLYQKGQLLPLPWSLCLLRPCVEPGQLHWRLSVRTWRWRNRYSNILLVFSFKKYAIPSNLAFLSFSFSITISYQKMTHNWKRN